MKGCELDNELFTCCQCKKEFDHTQGTWLPISEEEKTRMLSESNGILTVLSYGEFLKPT